MAEAKKKLGSFWEIESKDDVTVVRPDGSESLVASDGKVALYVLDVPGTFTAEVAGEAVSVKAG